MHDERGAKSRTLQSELLQLLHPPCNRKNHLGGRARQRLIALGKFCVYLNNVTVETRASSFPRILCASLWRRTRLLC
jgi:hypothetical protein